MKYKVLTILLFIIIFYSCEKENEVVIDEQIDQVTNKSEVKRSHDLESKPLEIIKKSDNLRILVRADGAPGMYLGEDSEIHGFYVDLEKMIMDKMDQKYEFIPYTDVGPAVHEIKTGASHIALSVPDLPDYRSFLNLSMHYETLNYVTFVRNDDKSIYGDTKDKIIKSLYGKRVGVQTQGHIYQILRDIKDIEIVEYPTTTKAMADLDNGLLDAVPDVKRIGEYYSRLNSWDIKPVGEAIISHKISTGFSKKYDMSLVVRYNKALEELLNDGSLEELWVSYFGTMSNKDRP